MGAAVRDTRFPGGGPASDEAPAVVRPLRILHLEDSYSDSDPAREHLESEGIPCELLHIETRQQFEEAPSGCSPLVVIGGFARHLEQCCAGRIEADELEMLRKVGAPASASRCRGVRGRTPRRSPAPRRHSTCACTEDRSCAR